MPGKVVDDKKQQQAQQVFHDDQLQPRLDEAKQGKRTVLFVDAAHFVMGAFLGMVWSFVRVLLPSASGRRRHNVLGAYDPIRHEAITVTNDTYINQSVFCEFLDKIAAAYADTGRPITLVLDNAKYRKRSFDHVCISRPKVAKIVSTYNKVDTYEGAHYSIIAAINCGTRARWPMPL
jgi:hypothetical protein